MNSKPVNQVPSTDVRKYKILLENYNTKTKNYELGKQEIFRISLLNLKSLLKEIPFEFAWFPVRIITDNFIITKESSEECKFISNNRLYEYESSKILINKIESELEKRDKKEQEISKSPKYRSLLSDLDKSIFLFLLPIFSIIIFGLIENIFILSITIWATIFNIYSIGFFIDSCLKLKKNPQKIKIEYANLFINMFDTENKTHLLILLSMLYLTTFNILLYTIYFASEPFFYHFFLIFFIVNVLFDIFALFFMCISLRRIVNLIKERKSLIIQSLFQYIQMHADTWDAKNFFYQQISELEKKPNVSFGLFPKMLALFTVIITITPLLFQY